MYLFWKKKRKKSTFLFKKTKKGFNFELIIQRIRFINIIKTYICAYGTHLCLYSYS